MKKLDILIIPTGPSFEEDQERTERALQEKPKYFMISGIQNSMVEMHIVNTYSLSQIFQIYKNLKKKHIPPSKMLISKGHNSEGNIYESFSKINNLFKGNEKLNVGIVSYPSHLNRFNKIYKNMTSDGRIEKTHNFYRVETDQTFNESVYEIAYKIISGIRFIRYG